MLVVVALDEALATPRPAEGSLAADDDDLAQQAADSAVRSILRDLDEFRGLGPFTTWAFRVVISEVCGHGGARGLAPERPPSRDEAGFGTSSYSARRVLGERA